MGKAKQLGTELVDIHSVKPYHANAKVGDVDSIRESIRLNGMYRPIVVWTKTSEILAGNHTWKACMAEAHSRIWITRIECDEETAKRINLADNRLPELGGYDIEILIAELGSLPDLAGTGYSTEDLEDLLAKIGDTPESEHDGEGDGDGTSTELGVLVMVRDIDQQQKVFDQMNTMIQIDPDLDGALIKTVSV